MRKKIAALAVALFACCSALSVAAQDAVAQFYRGRTITLVVGSTAGGGYDAYARLLGRHLGKHLPGEPSVIVTDMPGAGSEVAAAYVARVAAKDGTYIAAPYANLLLGPILEDAPNMNFDPNHVNYLGSSASDVGFCFVRPDAPATTFDQMFKTQVIMAGDSANAVAGYLPTMLNNVLGTKFKVVLGYPGAVEMMMAVEKGEVQGQCGMGWTSVMSQYKEQLKNGVIKLFAQVSEKGLPEINKTGVPVVASYARDEQQRRILEIILSQEVFARPYFVASEVPPDRVQILRRAFMESCRDPELLEDAANMKFVVAPTSGEEIQALLQKIYASPPALLQSAKEAIKPK